MNCLTREYMQEELVQMVEFKAVELQINKTLFVKTQYWYKKGK